jgi:hypothetical protein
MITVLSFGAGQDSTAILYRIVYDKEFRDWYVKGRLIVIMSDTGDEHDDTYEHVAFIKSFCKQHDIEFYFIEVEQGFHPPSAPGLIPWLKRNDTLMSVAYDKTCTDNLKIKPIYNFLDYYLGVNVYHRNIKPREGRKKFIYSYRKQYGKLRVLIGLAKGEEKRVAADEEEEFTLFSLPPVAPSKSSKKSKGESKKKKSNPLVWMQKCIEKIYPLIEIGMDRAACQQWILKAGLPLPFPSNCKRCPFMNEIELVWLFRFYPDAFWEWVDLERAKVAKSHLRGISDHKNLGVFGKLMLPEVLQIALQKYGHLTNDQLNEYKMSHGHCVQSTY